MVLQHTMQELTDKLEDAKTAYEDAVSEVEEYQTALSTDQYKADDENIRKGGMPDGKEPAGERPNGDRPDPPYDQNEGNQQELPAWK